MHDAEAISRIVLTPFWVTRTIGPVDLEGQIREARKQAESLKADGERRRRHMLVARRAISASSLGSRFDFASTERCVA